MWTDWESPSLQRGEDVKVEPPFSRRFFVGTMMATVVFASTMPTPVVSCRNHAEYEERSDVGAMFPVPVWSNTEPTDKVDCYWLRCPGCGKDTVLQIAGTSHPRWDVMTGNPKDPSSITLHPSIFHNPDRGGCGWHGWLRNGILEQC